MKVKKFAQSNTAVRNENVPPTVMAFFILANDPIKIDDNEQRTKLKQLDAVDDLPGYKSTNNVVIVDRVLIAQYDDTHEVINAAEMCQPLSTDQPNRINDATAMKFCGNTHINLTLNVLNVVSCGIKPVALLFSNLANARL